MSSGQEKSQYHHYIPRFMLRKWKVDYVPPLPPPDPDAAKKNKKKGKYRKPRHRQTPEDYINMYDAQADTLRVGVPLSKAYGTIDMYKSDFDADNAHYIEQLFSKLESQAATVLRELDKKVAAHQATISLPRRDVNTLRKFLFLLNYRSGRHSRQFLEERFDESTKAEVETFRQKHNLKDIPAVWLFNLRNMLESEHWEIPTNEKILKSDRDLYQTHLHSMQLAFYTCSDDSEFVLTDNGLGLWEGTHLRSLTFMGLATCPGVNPSALAWRHTSTYPVSPRLLILLRSSVMSQQQMLMEAGYSREESLPTLWGDKVPDNSYFKDFPRTPATVHYNPPLSGTMEECFSKDRDKIDGRIVGSRVKDTLTFHIHSLNIEQSRRVNALRLENRPRILTFMSTEKLLSSIRFHESTDGTNAVGDPLNQAAYKRVSYASLTQQLQHLLKHGVPPLKDTHPDGAPSPTPATDTAGPSNSTSQDDLPLIEQLRLRSASTGGARAAQRQAGGPPPSSARPDRKKEESNATESRKPRLKRHVYLPPVGMDEMTATLLEELATQFLQEDLPGGASRDSVVSQSKGQGEETLRPQPDAPADLRGHQQQPKVQDTISPATMPTSRAHDAPEKRETPQPSSLDGDQFSRLSHPENGSRVTPPKAASPDAEAAPSTGIAGPSNTTSQDGLSLIEQLRVRSSSKKEASDAAKSWKPQLAATTGHTFPTNIAAPSHVTSQGISPTEDPPTRPAFADSSGGLGPTTQPPQPGSSHFGKPNRSEEDINSTTRDTPDDFEYAPHPDSSNFNSESSTSPFTSIAGAMLGAAAAWWGYQRYRG